MKDSNLIMEYKKSPNQKKLLEKVPMYLNEKKLKVVLFFAKVQMVVGMIFVVFFGFGVVCGVLNYNDMRTGLPVYIVCILPFLWLVWRSRQKRQMIEKARQLNHMFCADADGDIQASQLIPILNSRNEYQAMKTVRELIGKGFLTNCTIEQQPCVHVVLYRRNTVVGIESVQCPNCSANVDKRVGFSATCPYCGTKILDH